MFKILTYGSGGKVAINPLHIMHIDIVQCHSKAPVFTELTFTNGTKIQVTESHDQVVKLLSF